MSAKRMTNNDKLIYSIISVINDGKSLVTFFLVSLLILISVFTVIDIYTNNDTSLSSSKSVLNDENVQYEIRTNEAKFREQLTAKLKALYKDRSFYLIDSLSKNSLEAIDVKKFIIINKIKKGKKTQEFYIKVEKLSSPLIEIKGVKTKLEIDFDKLINIIQSSKSELNEDTIKYGNYVKTEYDLDKQIKSENLIILIFLLAVGVVFLYFRNKIGLKNNEDLEDIVDSLNSDREVLKQAKNILNENKISKKEIERLKNLVNHLEENFNNYSFDDITESVLYLDTKKAEKRSLELYNRSTFMLILGLLIAVVGVLVFYFTLPEFNSIKSPTDYLAITIRPTLLLLFVQSISFYLLRQYRSLINDYKYFHHEYLKKSKIFIIHQLMQKKDITKIERKLIDSLLSSDNQNELGNIEEEYFSKDNVIDVLKIIVEKFK